MKNKQLIITLSVVGTIAIAAYIAYVTLMKKGGLGGLAGGSLVPKKKTVATSKQLATAAANVRSNPSDIAAQTAYINLGKSLIDALIISNKNATPTTSPKGTPAITVDKKGSYIEKDDPTTLYDYNGNPKGDLDPVSGMFVDANGKIIANSDGTPCTTNKYGNIVESDGSEYSLDGTPIKQFDNGTYQELDNDGNVIGTYADDGTPIKLYGDGSYDEIDEKGNVVGSYDYDGYEIDRTATAGNPNDDEDNIGASGYRSTFGKKNIHSLFK
jgi:hypothetical protein